LLMSRGVYAIITFVECKKRNIFECLKDFETPRGKEGLF